MGTTRNVYTTELPSRTAAKQLHGPDVPETTQDLPSTTASYQRITKNYLACTSATLVTPARLPREQKKVPQITVTTVNHRAKKQKLTPKLPRPLVCRFCHTFVVSKFFHHYHQ